MKAQKVGGNGIKAALTNSFGFGGTNACLCFVKIWIIWIIRIICIIRIIYYSFTITQKPFKLIQIIQ